METTITSMLLPPHSWKDEPKSPCNVFYCTISHCSHSSGVLFFSFLIIIVIIIIIYKTIQVWHHFYYKILQDKTNNLYKCRQQVNNDTNLICISFTYYNMNHFISLSLNQALHKYNYIWWCIRPWKESIQNIHTCTAWHDVYWIQSCMKWLNWVFFFRIFIKVLITVKLCYYFEAFVFALKVHQSTLSAPPLVYLLPDAFLASHTALPLWFDAAIRHKKKTVWNQYQYQSMLSFIVKVQYILFATFILYLGN